jgi:DNA-directed RNA polymerase specialized sigma24 family protein
MAQPKPTPHELKALTERLVRTAGTGAIPIPFDDREDVAQETMLRLVKETPRADAPPLHVRSLATLKQVKVDHLRRRSRAKEPELAVVEDLERVGREDDAMRLMELRETVTAVLDEEALAVAEAQVDGMTEAELGTEPGWTDKSAHAARRRLKRGAERLRTELLDD